MELISLQSFLLIFVFLVAYYLAAKIAPKHQWLVLLVGSLVYYFYSAGLRAITFLLVTSLATWCGAIRIRSLSSEAKEARAQTKDREERKAIRESFKAKQRTVLIASLVICFGMLAYVKYWNTILYNFGLATSTNSLGILLPLGISFYMFQSLGYVIDVYNERFEPEQNFAKHLTFVCWFPQMIQGPINRYAEIGPSFFESREFSEERLLRGFLLFGYGLFKKVCLATPLSYGVAAAFDHITPRLPGAVALCGVLTYSFQMYADFSGGIDMVRGISEMFGIEMALNFEQPYFSRSLAEFWRRWHMSLGEWMKNYVFYPLALTKPMQNLGKWAQAHAGRHLGRVLPACIANILVFLLVGFWHGAEWHFLAWGLYNGVVIALSDLLSPVFERLKEITHWNDDFLPIRIIATLRTFIVVNIGRYFDVIPDIGNAWIALKNTVVNFAPESIPVLFEHYGIPAYLQYGFSKQYFLLYACVFMVSLLKERGVDVRAKILSWPFPLRLLLYVAVWLAISSYFETYTYSGGAFLYANF